MRRFWIGLLGSLLLIGLVASPAGAAKGSTKASSVRGTFSGTVDVLMTCGYAYYGQWDNQSQQQLPPEYQTYVDYTITATGLAVNASTIGRGTMSWTNRMTPVPDRQQTPEWTFTASNGGSTLTAPDGSFNLQMGGMGGPMATWSAGPLVGTGKFAGVKQNSNLQTASGFLLVQPSSDMCDYGTPTDAEVAGQLTTVGSTILVHDPVSNVLFVGYLFY